MDDAGDDHTTPRSRTAPKPTTKRRRHHPRQDVPSATIGAEADARGNAGWLAVCPDDDTKKMGNGPLSPTLPPRRSGYDPLMAALITFTYNDTIIQEYGSLLSGVDKTTNPRIEMDTKARSDNRMQEIEVIFSYHLHRLLASGHLFASGFRDGEVEPVQPSCEWWENAMPSIRSAGVTWNGVTLSGLRLFQSPPPEQQSSQAGSVPSHTAKAPFDPLKAKALLIAKKLSNAWSGPPSEQESRDFFLQIFSGVPNDAHRKIRREVWPGQIKRGPKSRTAK